VTAAELTRLRRNLESRLAEIEHELMRLCAQSNRAAELSVRRTAVVRELGRVRDELARLRADVPRPRSAAWDRER
jgi:hypothetical protein